jgi:membrane-associated phospholipid phosphatase
VGLTRPLAAHLSHVSVWLEPFTYRMPAYRPPKERERDLAITSAALAASATTLLLLTRVALRPQPNRVDMALTRLLQRRHSRRVRQAMALISLPGFAPLEHVLTVGTALNFWSFGYRREALFTLLTMGAGAITGVVKVAVGRPRPDHSLRRSSVLLRDNSFPSGHCAHYASFYGYLFYLASRCMAPSPLRTAILLLCAGLIVLVPPSRVYLGHHWSSDVVAGNLLGLTYLFALIEVYERIAVTERAPYTVS